MNKKVKLFLFVLAFAIVLGGAYFLYSQYSTEPPPAPDIETQAQLPAAVDFTVYDADGNPVKLSDYFGKPIVVNFWASWCGPCQSEMPAFQQAYETYGDRVHFLMVNMTDGARETVEVATNFIEGRGYTFPILFDTQYDATITYQVYSLPTTLFITKEGNILVGRAGALSHEFLDSYIRQLLS